MPLRSLLPLSWALLFCGIGFGNHATNTCEGFERLRTTSIRPTESQLTKISQRFTVAATKPPLEGVKLIYESRDLVPENGKVHVVGPGLNRGGLQEWILPMLFRPDARILVSEPEFFGESQLKVDQSNLDDWLRRVYRKHLGLDASSALRDLMEQHLIKNEDQFIERVKKQVTFAYTGTSNREPIDFLFIRAPSLGMLAVETKRQGIDLYPAFGKNLYEQVKPGGHIWLYTDGIVEPSQFRSGDEAPTSLRLPLRSGAFYEQQVLGSGDFGSDYLAAPYDGTATLIRRPD